MKEQFKKIMLIFTLCFMILPASVYASESKEVEKDFTIEVSNEEISKDNSFSVDVESDKKEEKSSEKVNKGISKDEMRELFNEYSKKNNTVVSALATPQSNARGTVVENVGVDNKEYPIRRDIGTKETQIKNSTSNNKDNSSQLKERPSSDARQFLTFTTKSGKVFHLIVDHDKTSDNVQLLTEVSEQDLLNMIETKEVKEAPIQEIKKEEPKEEVVKVDKKQNSGLGSYLILGIVLAGALGAGYYFKIVKPKQEKEFDFEEEEEDEDFFEESSEELKEENDENI